VTIPVFKAAAGVALASVVLGQTIDLQLSGAQVVGWAVGLVGFLIAGLISLVSWFISKKLTSIDEGLQANTELTASQGTEIKLIRKELDSVSTWKAERQRAHDEAGRDTARRLNDELDRRRREG
jgi:hypothetical protein